MNFRYRAFGLNFDSPLELPQFLHGDSEESADVIISFGDTPENLPNPEEEAHFFQSKPNELLIMIEDVARYYLKDGNSIKVTPLTENMDAVRLFLTGSVLTGILHQRGYFPIHACVIEIEGKAVAFSGQSGAGKSTIAAAFAKRGFRILSDDVCAVKLSEGAPVVYPASPQIKLLQNTLEQFEMSYKDLPEVGDERRKYRYMDSASFHEEPLILSCIYLIRKVPKEEIEIWPLEGVEKFKELVMATHKRNILKGQRDHSMQFEACQFLSRHVDVKKLKHTRKLDQLNFVIDAVLEDLAESEQGS